ncbi:MAG: response regulator transcription factor [Chitinophagaceae bacterium]|nr:response regulator transcription factor [Chitinophagaceae bacterium]
MQNKKLLVLVVDDSQLMINKIKELLEESAGIQRIITSSSYEEAIKLIDAEEPDVALLDINLPFFKSGIDILRYIKQNFQKTKIIMFTNEVSEYHKDLCLKLGASHFVDKSVGFDSLSQLVCSLN